MRRVLLRTLRRAGERADGVRDRCGRQAQGDRYLLVLEPATDETRVVPRLLDGLAEGLAAANRHPAPSGPLHRALDEYPDAPLAAAFSDPLHQDVVGNGCDGLAADGFRRAAIEVAVKNFTGAAWIRAVRPAVAAGG
ncbi:hypothetical protein ACH4U3_30830 [Streptomyces griseoruber]|uniref:hypothetical protein n=1 Tax=Streptomyces griseoruber TaxID=1943 RepID=UPI0037ABB45D